jgi:hypothetical protein
MVSTDPAIHEEVVRDSLQWMGDADLSLSPAVLAQRVHRRLRQMTGIDDAYRAAKDRQNQLAVALLPSLRSKIARADDPLKMAVRVAIAGNVIDLGASGEVTERDLMVSLDSAIAEPVRGALDELVAAIEPAGNILYLADNCGEIAFDRLLIEQLSPKRVTVAVRGAPVLNDATTVDADAVGLSEIVEVIDNGSDAPATILEDCSPAFRARFAAADVVIAKGQGNYESLSDESRLIFFLFKVKCPVVAAHVGQPEGVNAVARTG